MQPHTKPAHYLATTYDTKARFASYWQQAQLIQSTNAAQQNFWMSAQETDSSKITSSAGI